MAKRQYLDGYGAAQACGWARQRVRGWFVETLSAIRASAPGESGQAEADAWSLICRLARLTRRPGFDPTRPQWLRVKPDGDLTPLGVGEPRGSAWAWRPGRGWVPPRSPRDPGVQALLDLYLPLCGSSPAGAWVVGHLGQSLDGFIATGCGDSFYVTGPENMRHLHRLRALNDAVLVGTETAVCDDPRLTTRLVPGDNPVRVILDRQRRLPPGLRLFTDGAAQTLLCCDEARVGPGRDRQGQARVLGIPCRNGRLDLRTLLEALQRQGLRRLFVEGGGALVSAFLTQGLLDRLHLTLAPLVIGTGRPGLRIPAPERLADAHRPPVRLFRMGADLLYDLDFSARSGTQGDAVDGTLAPLARVY
jgi:diaminohydroxyphosphoribosylaminopyrimidine deaminase / 5-amino-6-(5-phosphoribosylamino)uracil reductase